MSVERGEREMVGRTELDFSEAKKFEQLIQRAGKNVVITVITDSHTLELVLAQDDYDKLIEGGQPFVLQNLEGVA